MRNVLPGGYAAPRDAGWRAVRWRVDCNKRPWLPGARPVSSSSAGQGRADERVGVAEDVGQHHRERARAGAAQAAGERVHVERRAALLDRDDPRVERAQPRGEALEAEGERLLDRV